MFHSVYAAEKSEKLGVATPGKSNTDEPVTGLIIENLVPKARCNFPDIDRALGGLLGGLVVVAVVREVAHISGLDIGGLTC